MGARKAQYSGGMIKKLVLVIEENVRFQETNALAHDILGNCCVFLIRHIDWVDKILIRKRQQCLLCILDWILLICKWHIHEAMCWGILNIIHASYMNSICILFSAGDGVGRGLLYVAWARICFESNRIWDVSERRNAVKCVGT